MEPFHFNQFARVSCNIKISIIHLHWSFDLKFSKQLANYRVCSFSFEGHLTNKLVFECNSFASTGTSFEIVQYYASASKSLKNEIRQCVFLYWTNDTDIK